MDARTEEQFFVQYPVLNRNKFSYEVLWENLTKKMSLHSYVVNIKSKGKKNVLALAITPLLGTTIDDKKKTALLKLHDFTKEGTDIMDPLWSVNNGKKTTDTNSFDYAFTLAERLIFLKSA